MEDSGDVAHIGIRDVDEEHRVQFRLLIGIQQEVEASNRGNVLTLLQQLYDYSQAHFATEQTFMRLHAYPARQSHEREHEELLYELKALIDAARNSEAIDIQGWPQAIRRWLLTHINTADVAYGKWVRARQHSP